ncbi:MAG: precorrin-2 C(20)-methyltransferase [Chlorobiales bacterium]|nr:precorrin-2 C(20)-methyltransferase [Chlorobiales bacterium]
MNKQGSIISVSLGPGDPGLITVRALEQLRKAEVIYYPGTVSASGAVTSVALDILEAFDLDPSKLRGMLVPMSRSREAAEAIYAANYASMVEAVRAGRRVVVVSVGDGGFYSTASAIIERARRDGLECLMTPGIPAFIAAGSAAGMPLALQSDSVLVLAQIDEIGELERALADHSTVVVMKLSTVKKELVGFLERYARPFLYAEKVGMAGEFITMEVDALQDRVIPYFSLLVCSPHCRQSILSPFAS